MEVKEAFEKFLKDNHYNCEEDELIEFELRQVEQAFEAGAEWMKQQMPKWKKFSNQSCWSGEIGCNPSRRRFEYEHYAINADKLFKLLPKEEEI